MGTSCSTVDRNSRIAQIQQQSMVEPTSLSEELPLTWQIHTWPQNVHHACKYGLMTRIGEAHERNTHACHCCCPCLQPPLACSRQRQGQRVLRCGVQNRALWTGTPCSRVNRSSRIAQVQQQSIYEPPGLSKSCFRHRNDLCGCESCDTIAASSWLPDLWVPESANCMVATIHGQNSGHRLRAVANRKGNSCCVTAS